MSSLKLPTPLQMSLLFRPADASHTLPFLVVLLCVILQGWIYKEDNVMRDLKNSLQELAKRLQDPQTKHKAAKQQKRELWASPNERAELQLDTWHLRIQLRTLVLEH